MAVDNPWSAEFWSITAQGAYIKQYGLSVAQRTARRAGSAIGALKPNGGPEKVIERHWIITKKLEAGGGITGSSGSGAPS